MPEVEVVPIEYLSHNGKTSVKATVWQPAPNGNAQTGPIRGIIQIVHGMSEHRARYDAFARYLANAGYIVCANDHVGHGESVSSLDELGKLPVRGGKELLIEDVHALRRIMSERCPGEVPYVLLGHSMGSFISYAYAARYGTGLCGLVLSGTARMPRVVAWSGRTLARTIAAARGEDYVSNVLHAMGVGAYNKKIDHARTEFDWLSTDPAVVDAYRNDELCGARFSSGGYATLTDLLYEIGSPACARRIPAHLPVLLVAGQQDPVGDFGKGVQRARDLLVRAGADDVTMTLYEGMRHEILNEPDRLRVWADVLGWIDNRCLGRCTE